MTKPSYIVLALAAVGLGLVLLQEPFALISPIWLGAWVLGAITLELAAPKLPGLGFLSPGFVLVLGMAAKAEFGIKSAFFVLLVSLCVRTLFRPQNGLRANLAVLLQDLVPGLVGLFVLKLCHQHPALQDRLSGIAAAAVFLPFYLALSRHIDSELGDEQEKKQRSLVLGRAVSAYLVAGLLVAASLGVHGFFLFAASLLLLIYFREICRGAELDHREYLQLKVERRESTLKQTQDKIDRLQGELRLRGTETAILNSINGRLVRTRSTEEALQELLAISDELLGLRSSAFFMAQANRIIRPEKLDDPKFRAPDRPNDLIRESFKLARQRVRQVAPSLWHLAAPIGKWGVLYLVRGKDFSPRDKTLVTLVREHAVEALQSAQQHESKQEVIEQKVAQERQLRAIVQMLDIFIDLSLRFASCPSPKGMVEVARQRLLDIFKEQHCFLVLEEEITDWAGEHQKNFSFPLEQSLLGSLQQEQVSYFDSQGRGQGSQPALVVAPIGHPTVGLLCIFPSAAFDHESERRIELFRILFKQGTENLHIQSQLLQGSKLAAVGQLAAGLAHEINNPLAAIDMGIQTAKSVIKSRPEAALKRLDATEAPLERVRGLLDRLLTSAENKEVKIELEPIDLVDVLSSVESELRTLVGSCPSIQLRLEKPGSLPVLGHTQTLQEMIVNLVCNSRDAMEADNRAGDLEVRLFQDEEMVLLEVSDEGPGVPQQNLKSLFEPFFTTKAPGKGTGLGLYVASETAKQHGGQLELVKNGSDGCCFRLSLPLRGC